MKYSGVSLVELLIGMVMLAMILTALLGLTLGTLNYSTKAVSTAERLQELTTTSAYLGDNFQRAAEVITSLTVNSLSCNLSSSLPCIALVVPEARVGLDIDTYMLLAYRLEPRSNLASIYKADNAWVDQNSLVLMEYRKELCGGSTGLACSGVPTVASSVTGLTAFVVSDNLVKASEMSGKTFLEYDGKRNLTLRLRVKDHLRGTTHFTPESLPYELLITRRN